MSKTNELSDQEIQYLSAIFLANDNNYILCDNISHRLKYVRETLFEDFTPDLLDGDITASDRLIFLFDWTKESSDKCDNYIHNYINS